MIESDRIPAAFDGIKFAVLADLHNNTFGKNNKKLLYKIEQISPEFILIAGDMVVGRKQNNDEVALSLITELVKKYPIYYGFGNHEQRVAPGGINHNKLFDEYVNTLKKIGVHILINDSIYMKRKDDRIAFTGLLIGEEYFKKVKQPIMKKEYVQNLIGISDKKCYNILIAHNPVYFKHYVNWGADLTLSGHLHGGIVRIPYIGGVISPQYKLFPKYDAGRFDLEGKTMLVSRGLGTHTIKLRLFNKPELMIVTLRIKDKN